MLIYEINTWIWLDGLSHRLGKPISLDSVPASEWDRLAEYGFDAIWLMGVWERSPEGTTIARERQGLEPEFRRVLPDYEPSDVSGSPYCIHNYQVDPHLGGPRGLAVARQELASRGLRLILDFVPNHVAPDHPWLQDHPNYFVAGSAGDLAGEPASYLQIGEHIVARGRDPYFPAWPDTAQLNAFDPGLRRAAIATMNDIAAQCDGVRCDMAMLLLNSVFAQTWGARAGSPPPTEYWHDVIQAVREGNPGFVFIAEAYWDLEWNLQQLGFSYCYDKRLYDRLEHDTAESVRLHLTADMAYQSKLVRFIENHDEPRAASVFDLAQQRAAAVVISTIPGAKLFHDGQFDGLQVKLPVQLGRAPVEPANPGLHEFYRRLLKAIRSPAIRHGEWSLCQRTGWPDNQSYLNIVAWTTKHGPQCALVIVNLSDDSSQARVQVPWDATPGTLRLSDPVQGQEFLRDAEEIRNPGLYVDLEPWAFHVLLTDVQ